jgi:neutral ceramidase
LLLAAQIALGADLRVGKAVVKITPPPGVPMAGYYSIRLAEGTHDDLYAKAIVFEYAGAKAAMVACDLVGIERQYVVEARRLIEIATGIRGTNVSVMATHSHTGPLLSQRFLAAVEGAPLKLAREYQAALPVKIAESVKLANASLTEARLYAGLGTEETIGFNRRYLMKDGSVKFNPGKMNPEIVQPVGPIDPDVYVVYAESAAGKPLATHVNFAMHLDTVGGVQYSADYPYTIARTLGQIKGPEMMTLFTIGAAGNVNHIDVKSKERQQGHAEAQRIGMVLAGETIKTYARMKPVAAGPVRVKNEIVRIPLAEIKPEQTGPAKQTVARFGKPGQPPFLEMVEAMKVLDVTGPKRDLLEAEVQVIMIGELAYVSLPGEIFTELGIAIKKASPFPLTIVNELANGSIGYVPNRKAYAEGAYEVISARCGPGCGEALVDAAIRLLADMKRGR